jgi:hypothetical protein
LLTTLSLLNSAACGYRQNRCTIWIRDHFNMLLLKGHCRNVNTFTCLKLCILCLWVSYDSQCKQWFSYFLTLNHLESMKKSIQIYLPSFCATSNEKCHLFVIGPKIQVSNNKNFYRTETRLGSIKKKFRTVYW